MVLVIIQGPPCKHTQCGPHLRALSPRNVVSATFELNTRRSASKVHDDETLIEDVIYAFSFFPFLPLLLQLCLTFQRRGFQGNETDGIANFLLGPVPPPSVFLLCPIPRAKATIFHPSPARRSSDPLTATSTSRYVPGISYALCSPVSLSLSLAIQSALPSLTVRSTIDRRCQQLLVAPVD